MAETTVHQRPNALGYLALLGSNILVFLGLFSLSPTLPGLRDYFSASSNVEVLTQLVGAASGFTFAIGCLLSSRIIDRFGYRNVYLISVILVGLVGACAALVNNLYWIILTRAVVGLAAAFIVNAALVAVHRLLNENEQGRVLGLQSMIGSCAGILLLPVIGMLSGMNWRFAFGVHLVGILFVPLVLMLPVRGAPTTSGAENGQVSGALGLGPLLVVAAMFVGMVLFTISMFAPLFLVSLGVTSTQLLSIPPTAAVVGGAAGSAFFVFLRSRLSVGRFFPLAFATMATGLVTIALSQSLWGVATGALVASIGCGVFIPNLYLAAIKASPGNAGPALGLANALLYGAMILFPLVATPLSGLVGGPRPVLMAFVASAAVLASFFMISDHRAGNPLLTGLFRTAASKGAENE